MGIKRLEELKTFLDKPMEEKVYFQKSTGNIHPQIIYNTYSLLKGIVEVLDKIEKRKEEK